MGFRVWGFIRYILVIAVQFHGSIRTFQIVIPHTPDPIPHLRVSATGGFSLAYGKTWAIFTQGALRPP
ncbi:MAG: hypothetical protein LBT01_09370 [Spirochaetaceae bacterium]|jgi:hypothetical protein|nr:hypothetical protein [Spirochaetaceae bacterium]